MEAETKRLGDYVGIWTYTKADGTKKLYRIRVLENSFLIQWGNTSEQLTKCKGIKVTDPSELYRRIKAKIQAGFIQGIDFSAREEWNALCGHEVRAIKIRQPKENVLLAWVKNKGKKNEKKKQIA